MKRLSRNCSSLLIVLLSLMANSSCNSSAKQMDHSLTTVLERGKAIDLYQIDFQKADLDQLFAKLAYVKNFKMGEDNIKYTKDQPLTIHPYILYNISEPRIVERYEKRESYLIKKGEMYADTVFIERSVPIIGLKDADMRTFGHWGQKDIIFNRIATSSTKKNKLIRFRLESDALKGVTEKTYRTLFELLKNKYKTTTVKVEPQENKPNSYQWKTKDQVVYLMLNKDEDLNNITIMVSFINADTKGFLPEFGH